VQCRLQVSGIKKGSKISFQRHLEGREFASKTAAGCDIKDSSGPNDLSIEDQVHSLFAIDSTKENENHKAKDSGKIDLLGSTAAEYNIDEACPADVNATIAKIVKKMVRTKEVVR